MATPAHAPCASAEFLLIDVGNSAVKMALATRQQQVALTGLATAGLTSDAIRDCLRRLGWQWRHALLCSVVPAVNRLFAEALAEPPAVLDASFDLGLEIDYPDPSSIGADRLANAAALVATGPGPGIVVDYGTAVTFDIVDHRPAYIGGVIAPGIALTTDYLAQRTALLPRIELQPGQMPPPWVGRTTRQAMLAGAFHGYAGMVNHLLRGLIADLQQRQQAATCPPPAPGTGTLATAIDGHPAGPPPVAETHKTGVRVLATGGDANLICAQSDFIQSVVPDLTINGLRIIACRRWPQPAA